MQYVTLFSCDTFGFYVSWVYLQYGVQVATREFPYTSETSDTLDGAFVGIILALLMLVTSFLFRSLSQSVYFHRHVRRFFADYGMPISLVASSAMAYWGRFDASHPSTLPTGPCISACEWQGLASPLLGTGWQVGWHRFPVRCRIVGAVLL